VQLKNHQQMEIAGRSTVVKVARSRRQSFRAEWQTSASFIRIDIRHGKRQWPKKQAELQVTNGNRKKDRN